MGPLGWKLGFLDISYLFDKFIKLNQIRRCLYSTEVHFFQLDIYVLKRHQAKSKPKLITKSFQTIFINLTQAKFLSEI